MSFSKEMRIKPSLATFKTLGAKDYRHQRLSPNYEKNLHPPGKYSSVIELM